MLSTESGVGVAMQCYSWEVWELLCKWQSKCYLWKVVWELLCNVTYGKYGSCYANGKVNVTYGKWYGSCYAMLPMGSVGVAMQMAK